MPHGPPLATDKADATAEVADHPAHHNALAAEVNALGDAAPYDVHFFGAVGGGRSCSDAVLALNSPVLRTLQLTAAVIDAIPTGCGVAVVGAGAGGGTLLGTVVARSGAAGTITLSAPAQTAVAGARAYVDGPDDDAAILAARDAAAAVGGTVTFRAGHVYTLRHGLDWGYRASIAVLGEVEGGTSNLDVTSDRGAILRNAVAATGLPYLLRIGSADLAEEATQASGILVDGLVLDPPTVARAQYCILLENYAGIELRRVRAKHSSVASIGLKRSANDPAHPATVGVGYRLLLNNCWFSDGTLHAVAEDAAGQQTPWFDAIGCEARVFGGHALHATGHGFRGSWKGGFMGLCQGGALDLEAGGAIGAATDFALEDVNLENCAAPGASVVKVRDYLGFYAWNVSINNTTPGQGGLVGFDLDSLRGVSLFARISPNNTDAGFVGVQLGPNARGVSGAILVSGDWTGKTRLVDRTGGGHNPLFLHDVGAIASGVAGLLRAGRLGTGAFATPLRASAITTGGAMTAGQPQLEDLTATFSTTTTPVGSVLAVSGAAAAGGTLYAVVQAITDGTHLVLGTAATTTVTGATVVTCGLSMPPAAIVTSAPTWGAGAALAVLNGTDANHEVRITTGTTPANSPQLLHLPMDGPWAAAPNGWSKRAGGPTGTVDLCKQTFDTLHCLWVYQGTPTAGSAYQFDNLVVVP